MPALRALVIETELALQRVPLTLHLVRAQRRMLRASLRELAARALEVALLVVNYRNIILSVVPQVVGLGRGVLDGGPQRDRILPVLLSLRDAREPCVGVRRGRVGFHDLLEDL